MSAILKNWLPSLAGIAAGALNMFANGTGWKEIMFSVFLGLLGIVSKQFNVTGGSVAATKEAESRTSSPKV